MLRNKCLLIASALALATYCPGVSAQSMTATNLTLVCKVSGQHKVETSSDSFSSGKDGKGEWRTGYNEQVVPFTDQISIVIEPGRAQLQYPRAALPTIHGGNDGWFDIRQLFMGQDEIKGEIAINFANHPKIKLDRRTGVISVSEPSGSFSGTCEKLDASRRAF